MNNNKRLKDDVGQIVLRIPESVKEEFRIVATERGLTMSAAINQYIRQAIREEKKASTTKRSANSFCPPRWRSGTF